MDAVGVGTLRRYRTAAPAIDASGVRTYSGRNRTVVVTPIERAGKNAVLYVDVPAGVSPRLLDLGRVTIGR